MLGIKINPLNLFRSLKDKLLNQTKNLFRFFLSSSDLIFTLLFVILVVIMISQLLFLLEKILTPKKNLFLKSSAYQERGLLQFVINKNLNHLDLQFIKPVYASSKPEFSYQASKTEQSYPDIINLKAGKAFTFWVKFKNTGSQIWQTQGPDRVVLRTASERKGVFCHPWWTKENQPSQLKAPVLLNKTALFRFAIQAPETNGLYWEKFNLFVNSVPIPGGEIEIPLRVYDGKKPVISQNQPQNQPKENEFEQNQTLSWWQEVSPDLSQIQEELKYEEPKTRVALYSIKSEEKKDLLPIQIIARDFQAYEVRDRNDYPLFKQTMGELTEIDFDFESKRFMVNLEGRRYLSTDSYLKFLPLNLDKDKDTIFEIFSLKNNVFWSTQINDNKFRGSLEIHYNPNTNQVWVVNELPMEEYLKGVAEVADSSPKEFLKAQMIAARTYAMFRKLLPKYTNTSERKPIFDLKSTQADQVYRGYGFEMRSPRTIEAVQETKGIMVFYQGAIAKTYYYAQSDGWTRDCQKVRMCKEFAPYLIPKRDPQGEGKVMRGHGVGLPQNGGRQAAQEGANFIQILKYFYPGIELKKVY